VNAEKDVEGGLLKPERFNINYKKSLLLKRLMI